MKKSRKIFYKINSDTQLWLENEIPKMSKKKYYKKMKKSRKCVYKIYSDSGKAAPQKIFKKYFQKMKKYPIKLL